MIDLLACIGFDVSDTDALREQLLQLAGQADERLVTPSGEYAIWRSRSGAELWFHIAAEPDENGEREIVGMMPFFEGTGEQRLSILSVDACSQGPFMCSCTARTVPAGLDASTELAFLVVDAAAFTEDQISEAKTFRISGFAKSIEIVPERTEPDARRFQQQQADDDIPRAVLSGRITSVATLRNEASKGAFLCLKLGSDDSGFDLVATMEYADLVAPGALIQADCNLLGRMLD